ncbi:hypothetical protein NIES208_17875 [[Limnothrix rosea] IAM M-220]|nr:hypothetical protein NIES208_17875 [[Limnothrix rosea] IAM M-220]
MMATNTVSCEKIKIKYQSDLPAESVVSKILDKSGVNTDFLEAENSNSLLFIHKLNCALKCLPMNGRLI